MSEDSVNHPNHYTSGPFECIRLTERYGFKGGNAIKYVYRWRDKNGVEDLKKAYWYLAHTGDRYDRMPLMSLMDFAVHRPFVPSDDYIDYYAVFLLRKLERLDWQDMHNFWKGMAEIACGYESGYTRAVRALERRISLLESPLSDLEKTVLNELEQHENIEDELSNVAYRLQARGLIALDMNGDWMLAPSEG